MCAQPSHHPRRFVVFVRGTSAAYLRKGSHITVRKVPLDDRDVNVRVFTRFQTSQSGVTTPLYLEFEIEGDASSIDDACEKFGSVASGFTPAIGVCTNAGTTDLHFHRAVEITESVGEREFRQAIREDAIPVDKTLREIPIKDFRVVFEALFDSPHHERVHRAMAHYSMSLERWGMGQDILVMAHLYMGAETLSEVLVKLDCEQAGVSKKELAERQGIRVRDLAPLKRKEVIFRGDEELYKAAKSVSDGWEHGYESFGKVYRIARKIKERSAALLREALLSTLLGDNASYEHLLKAPYKNPKPPLGFARIVSGKLHGNRDVLVPPGEPYPELINLSVKPYPSSSIKESRLDLKYSMETVLPKGVTLMDIEVLFIDWR